MIERFSKHVNPEEARMFRLADWDKRWTKAEGIRVFDDQGVEYLDIFWLKDESLEETENLPEPSVIADDIVSNLESALEQFRAITEQRGDDDADQAGVDDGRAAPSSPAPRTARRT